MEMENLRLSKYYPRRFGVELLYITVLFIFSDYSTRRVCKQIEA